MFIAEFFDAHSFVKHPLDLVAVKFLKPETIQHNGTMNAIVATFGPLASIDRIFIEACTLEYRPLGIGIIESVTRIID